MARRPKHDGRGDASIPAGTYTRIVLSGEFETLRKIAAIVRSRGTEDGEGFADLVAASLLMTGLDVSTEDVADRLEPRPAGVRGLVGRLEATSQDGRSKVAAFLLARMDERIAAIASELRRPPVADGRG